MTNKTPMSEKWWERIIDDIKPSIAIPFDVGMEFYEYQKAVKEAVESIISHARHMALEEAMEVARKKAYPTDNSESLFRQGYNEACNDILEVLNKLK